MALAQYKFVEILKGNNCEKSRALAYYEYIHAYFNTKNVYWLVPFQKKKKN